MYPIQPPNSSICGHCCLAVILGIPLQDAINLIGHERGTKTRELTRHFPHGRMKRGIAFRYALCICRPRGRRRGNWHWVLHIDGKIYCPGIGHLVDVEHYLTSLNCVVTSSIEVLSPVLERIHHAA